jgi:hypothetical protein
MNYFDKDILCIEMKNCIENNHVTICKVNSWECLFKDIYAYMYIFLNIYIFKIKYVFYLR